MNKFLPILVIWFSCSQAIAQQSNEEFDLEEFTERMFGVQTSDINYEDLYEQYLQWYLHPLNLNKATDEELRSLYILNNAQIEHLLKYREHLGPVLNINELQTLEGFSPEVIRNLQPFVTISDQGPTAVPSRSFIIAQTRRVIKPSQGQATDTYPGLPYKLFLRNKTYISKRSGFGLTLENDPGEKLAWNPAKNSFGSDFMSFHFQHKDQGVLKNLVIGDYQAQFGQGLVFGSGFFLGKGAETVSTVRKSNLGIRPYTSLVESGFMRGVAATVALHKMELTGMVSYTREDAALVSDSSTSLSYATRIRDTGLHRTTSEIESKAAMGRMVSGFNLTYNISDQIHVGVTSSYTRFNSSINPDSTYYNQFSFRGIENHNIGLFGSYNWRNVALFSEVARSRSGGRALLAGGIVSVGSQVDLSFHLRHYEPDFHSLYGSAFSEAAGLAGEKGAYIGLAYSPTKKVRITGYYDKFSFPWLRYRTFGTSDGMESLMRVSYSFSRDNTIYFQIRTEKKPRNASINSPIYRIMEGRKVNYLFNTDYAVTEWLNLKTRVQLSSFELDNSRSEGVAFIQDANIKFNSFGAGLRMAVFDTDDYENRQYAYERDVLYNFSIPAYYGRGTRMMMLLRYRISHALSAWARLAYTSYQNSRTPADSDAATKDQVTDLKFQLRYQF